MDKTVVCRECGATLQPEQIQAHLSMHWGREIPNEKTCKEAYSRYMHLLNFMQDAGVKPHRRENSL